MKKAHTSVPCHCDSQRGFIENRVDSSNEVGKRNVVERYVISNCPYKKTKRRRSK